jgi:hypothetical protein
MKEPLLNLSALNGRKTLKLNNLKAKKNNNNKIKTSKK